jgi:hypothetical protein
MKQYRQMLRTRKGPLENNTYGLQAWGLGFKEPYIKANREGRRWKKFGPRFTSNGYPAVAPQAAPGYGAPSKDGPR